MSSINKDWKTLKVDDVVYSYYKGLFVILAIEKRKDTSPLVTLRKLATHSCLPCKGTHHTCDITWCKLVQQNTIDYAKSNGVIFDI